MATQVISKAVGIDLGTTNSAVALMDPTDTDIIIHRDPRAKSETTPSCVWKDPRSGEIMVGRLAFRRATTLPLPVRSVKRLMGQQTTVRLTDEDVTPEYVSASILGEMKRQIEEDVAGLATDSTSWIVDRAIITVPAYFDQPQIDATRRAGEMAGLQVLDLLHEPTAAACYHCWRTGTSDGIFLVYDLGGGTFDVTVLRCTAGAFEVLGVSGNKRLGGDDLDVAIAQDLQARLLREDYLLDLDVARDPEDRLRFEQLKFMAEGLKKGLSLAFDFTLHDTSLKDQAGNPVLIDTVFERDEVDALIWPIVERTIPYCFDALEQAEAKADVKLADVTAIVLAGGSTHVPLVREAVRQNLCRVTGDLDRVVNRLADPRANQPRAQCDTPVYEQVDTIVALGAAIRAAAVGGLAVYNPERTVRVSFRGTGTTGARETQVGGRVEALTTELDLRGGRVRLSIADQGYDDEADLTESGTFAFRRVPLQAGAESLLSFAVYDGGGQLVATAGRPVSQSREAVRPTGGSTSTAVLSKALLLEVERAGRASLRELIPALATLPQSADFVFTHPGKTELIRLPLYQHKRKVQVILVPVHSSLPQGTPVELNVTVDELSFITVRGKIGETPFDAVVELPPERALPSAEEAQALERKFAEAVVYLPTGKQNVAKIRFKKTKDSYQAAADRGDKEQAVHDFEELEELVANISTNEGPLQPPKEFLTELVAECHELNQHVARAAAEAGAPHDHQEVARAIEAQRQQGEKAFGAADQQAYSDAIMMLESLRNHVLGLGQKIIGPQQDTRSDAERADAQIKTAGGEATKTGELAVAQKRPDLQDETDQIKRQLDDLAREAQKNPRAVQEKVSQLRQRLEQIKNVLMGHRPAEGGGVLVIDHTTPEQRGGQL